MRAFPIAVALTVLPALALPFAPSSPTTATAISSIPAATPLNPKGTGAEAPLVGTYECQGVEPDGTPYQGLVQITPNRGSYDVLWIFGSGQQYAGLGVVNGDVLAVSYFTNRPGVVAYKIEQTDKGPRLQGQWTVVGAGKVFQETLTRVTREVKRPERRERPNEPRPQAAPIMGHLRPA
jgi:hypothetical protein